MADQLADLPPKNWQMRFTLILTVTVQANQVADQLVLANRLDSYCEN